MVSGHDQRQPLPSVLEPRLQESSVASMEIDMHNSLAPTTGGTLLQRRPPLLPTSALGTKRTRTVAEEEPPQRNVVNRPTSTMRLRPSQQKRIHRKLDFLLPPEHNAAPEDAPHQAKRNTANAWEATHWADNDVLPTIQVITGIVENSAEDERWAALAAPAYYNDIYAPLPEPPSRRAQRAVEQHEGAASVMEEYGDARMLEDNNSSDDLDYQSCGEHHESGESGKDDSDVEVADSDDDIRKRKLRRYSWSPRHGLRRFRQSNIAVNMATFTFNDWEGLDAFVDDEKFMNDDTAMQ